MQKISGILIIQDIEANLTSKKLDKSTVYILFSIFLIIINFN